jgi:hypothetical protein
MEQWHGAWNWDVSAGSQAGQQGTAGAWAPAWPWRRDPVAAVAAGGVDCLFEQPCMLMRIVQ